MKNILKQIAQKSRQQENEKVAAYQAEISNPGIKDNRRDFLRKTSALFCGISLSPLLSSPVEETIEQVTSKVSRSSNPSDLKITDMRYCVITLSNTEITRNPIIRIDTNQGIYGLGEVRDGADERYALFLKSRILGENPCNVEMLFKIIKQFGYHGRQGGGVSGVEMALWDLAGKAYCVPCWQLLGGRYRDSIRLYAYVPESISGGNGMDVEKFRADIKHRTEVQGYTWLKFYPSLDIINQIPGTLVNTNFWSAPKPNALTTYGQTKQPFTQMQITDKGLDEYAKYVELVRSITGYEIPLSTDGYGNYDINNCIRVGRALEPYRLAWLEDMLSWEMTDQWKILTEALETPTITGEDIYLKEEFIKLCDTHAVDIIHPDMGTSGGILETKKIGDYAEERGIPMALHFAGSPVSFMANVHCAAATQNVLALEMPTQAVDNPWWEKLVRTTDGRSLITKGFANIPLTAPGLGIELNDDELKKHLHPSDKSYFTPTPTWDDKRSADHLWSGRYTIGQKTGVVPK